MMPVIPFLKLAPLLTLSLFMSCGKKISENSNAEVVQAPATQLPSSSLLLELNMAKSSNFFLNRGGHFHIPENISILSNNAAGKSVKIYFNYQEYTPAYEFNCTYTGTTQNFMTLKKCVGSNGTSDYGPIDMILNAVFILDPRTYVKMETSSTDLKVEAFFGVDWI